MPQPILHPGGGGDIPMDEAPAPLPATTTKKKSKPSGQNAATKKVKKQKKRKEKDADGGPPKRARTLKAKKSRGDSLTPAQEAAQEQMRRALEDDKYSAVGSIVEDTDSENDDHNNNTYTYRGMAIRIDKAAIQQAIRKHQLYERLGVIVPTASRKHEDEEEDGKPEADDTSITSKRNSSKPKKKKKRKPEAARLAIDTGKNTVATTAPTSKDPLCLDAGDDDVERDGSSIFGATQGANNSTWVECDKCKKWRRLRGVVDEKKLPPKWYCSMNKNDPDRARCSAPEEDYDTAITPESVADARTRKHLRVWVRRIRCNEAYEARQPTLTRGKKRAAVNSSKDAYEWVRCCNPSCGKWRAVLRFMDAKTTVVDRTTNGEWYCVMNNWDEKVASCAAPQENLPAAGCPPWILQDE